MCLARNSQTEIEMNNEQQLAEFIAQFYDDPLGFVLAAFPWDTDPKLQVCKLPEPWASRYPHCQFGPDAWACELLDNLGKDVADRAFDGRHAVDAIRTAVSSGHGIGKALRCSEVVDTPSGRTVWGDLRVGDLLWGPDGKPTRIVAIPFRGVRPQYRVTFDDRSSVVCSGEHLWAVRGRQQRRKGIDSYVNMTVDEIVAKGVLRANGSAMARQWEIPRQSPVEYPEVDLPLPPYLVGLFIGNGGGDACRIVTNEPEVFERLDTLGLEYSVQAKQGTDAKAFYVYGSRAALFALGFENCHSHEKFIPEAYKYASVEQRSELLRGLIDTDGDVSKSGTVTYSTTSERLRDDVVWLVRSLGGKALIRPTAKKAYYYNDGQKVPCRDCYQVTITMPRGFVAGYVKRKTERIKETVQDRYVTRWIDKIEPVGDDECMCVTVDRDDGLFLGPNFTVTHNSAITAWIVTWIMATRPYAQGTVTANTNTQLSTKTWAQISAWLSRSIVADWFDVHTSKQDMRISKTGYRAEWFVTAQSCRKENSEAFAGQHAASSTSFYVFDEASAVDESIFQVAEGGLSDGEPMIFAFGNPTRNSGPFYDIFHKNRHLWRTYQIDARTCQITNKRMHEQWIQTYGADSDFCKVRIYGQFPNQSMSQFISADIVDAAMQRQPPVHARAPRIAVMGVDFARFGDDETSIFVRVGRDGTLPIVKFQKLSGVQAADKVAERVNYVKHILKIPNVVIYGDAGGLGGPIMDILRARGYDARDVLFGQTPQEPNRFVDKRTEIWARMREALQSEYLSLAQNQELRDDMTGPEYFVDDKGRIRLESKKDMKARGLHSPDAADSVALTFAEPINEDAYDPDYASEPEFAESTFNPF